MEPKILVVTEKNEASSHLRDGGAMVIQTLKKTFGECLDVVQFDEVNTKPSKLRYTYPIAHPNRFIRRMLNSEWVAEKVTNSAKGYSHVIFIHISMLFGIIPERLFGCKIWLFPMLLGESYAKAGENVPAEYFEAEREALKKVDRIITPSHFEKQQLYNAYGVPRSIIKVIPRGISDLLFKKYQKTHNRVIKICSVGSIKPQKNVLELINHFACVRKYYNDATLIVIGPVQNVSYFWEVQKRVMELGLENDVTFTGYIPHEQLKETIIDCKFHLSATHCETFGRTIFETLSLGILNLLPHHKNCAALEHLEGLPYCETYSSSEELIQKIQVLLDGYELRSELATEISLIFSDERLKKLIRAEILELPELLVTDFDGTLFYKDNPTETEKLINEAKRYQKLIICSARSISDLREQVENLDIRPDWLVGLSGGEIESYDSRFRICYPLSDADKLELQADYPDGSFVSSHGIAVQMRVPYAISSIKYRAEKYNGFTYLCPRRNSKLNAVLTIIDHINFSGRVAAWGDGTNDLPYLTYFDGLLTGQNKHHAFLRTVINNKV